MARLGPCDAGAWQSAALLRAHRNIQSEIVASVPDLDLPPAGGHVASLASLAERAIVSILAAVTAVAIHRQLQIRRRLRLVTRLASELLMRTCQRKSGLSRVIESPQRPAIRIVAGGTMAPEPSLVKVLVTAFAGHRRVLVGGRAMTLLAGHRLVQADQGKTRDVMIE